MAYTYTTYRTALQTMVASQAPDAAFDTILPSAIDYAEQRMYRELDLLVTNVRDYSVTTIPSTRNITIPSEYVTIDGINALTPSGSNATTGVRSPITPVSRDLLDNLWPGNAVTGTPSQFAMITQWELILGPSPDVAYNLEIIGTQRPEPLSAANQTTFLSERLPDLFMAASMIFMSGYMRNYGAQASDPQQGMSWEQQYDLLFKSADTEEARKKFAGSSWSSQPVYPSAQPQRG